MKPNLRAIGALITMSLLCACDPMFEPSQAVSSGKATDLYVEETIVTDPLFRLKESEVSVYSKHPFDDRPTISIQIEGPTDSLYRGVEHELRLTPSEGVQHVEFIEDTESGRYEWVGEIRVEWVDTYEFETDCQEGNFSLLTEFYRFELRVESEDGVEIYATGSIDERDTYYCDGVVL